MRVQIVDEAPPRRGIAAIQATGVNGLLVWPHLCVCTLHYPTLNPLSPNVADLQHFDIELFCGFSLRNAFCPSTDIITVSLLVFPLSQALVMKVG